MSRARSSSSELVKHYGDVVAVDGIDLDIPRRRVLHDARPVGLRQDDHAAADRRLRAARRGRDPARRRRHVAHAAAQAARQHGLPELRAVPAHDGRATTSRFGLRYQQGLEGRDARGASTRRWRSCGSTGSRTRRPAQLSGGQQQRVALARALVLEPPVLLLDEPLGALDARLRVDLQVELKRIQETLGITFVYVTHDQDEALTMSDRVAVMRDGRIEQCGAPQRLYEEPRDGVRGELPRRSNLVPGRSRPTATARRWRSATSRCAPRAGDGTARRGAGDDPARARARSSRTGPAARTACRGWSRRSSTSASTRRCACGWRPARWSRSTCPTTATRAEYAQGDPVVRAPAGRALRILRASTPA